MESISRTLVAPFADVGFPDPPWSRIHYSQLKFTYDLVWVLEGHPGRCFRRTRRAWRNMLQRPRSQRALGTGRGGDLRGMGGWVSRMGGKGSRSAPYGPSPAMKGTARGSSPPVIALPDFQHGGGQYLFMVDRVWARC